MNNTKSIYLGSLDFFSAPGGAGQFEIADARTNYTDNLGYGAPFQATDYVVIRHWPGICRRGQLTVKVGFGIYANNEGEIGEFLTEVDPANDFSGYIDLHMTAGGTGVASFVSAEAYNNTEVMPLLSNELYGYQYKELSYSYDVTAEQAGAAIVHTGSAKGDKAYFYIINHIEFYKNGELVKYMGPADITGSDDCVLGTENASGSYGAKTLVSAKNPTGFATYTNKVADRNYGEEPYKYTMGGKPKDMFIHNLRSSWVRYTVVMA